MDDDDTERLFEAATSRGTTWIEKFVRSHPDRAICARNQNNQTLLHVAAGYGRNKLTSLLISLGSNVNAIDAYGQAPLHNACCHGHFNISKLLIDAGAEIDLTDHEGWSPLHFALSRKENSTGIIDTYWNVIRLLLECGADPYLESNKGHSCLTRVKSKIDRRTIRLLHLTRLLGLHENDKKRMYNLVEKYLKAEDLFELVKIGDEDDESMELLKKLLKADQLVHWRLQEFYDSTPLHRAAGYNQLKVAEMLLSKGARVDAVDGNDRIPLHNAAQYAHTDMIELLVRGGSDVNKQDKDGYSPLHVAACCCASYLPCLKLIELGADINLRCPKGDLAYDLAELNDIKEVLKPDSMRHELEITPSRYDHAIYKTIRRDTADQIQPNNVSSNDKLMLNSDSDEELFSNNNHSIKEFTLSKHDWAYRRVCEKMLSTIASHDGESGGIFTSYDILKIERILHKKVWKRYKLACERLKLDYGSGSKNEQLLFHGSNFISRIRNDGFMIGFAQRSGMFGAGIYFAEQSSKSNQYAYGLGQGCHEHKDKSCYRCERQMIYAQVALGKTYSTEEPHPEWAHAPPGHSSVTGKPGEHLKYPEHVIYSDDQAYPLFVITYKIKP